MIQGDHIDMLFTALAEQLKTPLLQIARLSEVSHSNSSGQVSVISEHALRLVDSFLQTQAQNQTKLLLEPINTSAILYEVAHTLQPYAKHMNYELLTDVQGKSVPIMAHRESLRSMLTLLGASLMEVGPEERASLSAKLVLGMHRSASGTIVGAFSNQVAMTQKVLVLARLLSGRVSQVSPLLGQVGGAGLAIADALSLQLNAPLHAYRHSKMAGVGTLLLPSHQLQLHIG